MERSQTHQKLGVRVRTSVLGLSVASKLDVNDAALPYVTISFLALVA